MSDHDGRERDSHDLGLHHDLQVLAARFAVGRRRALRLIGGAGLLPLVGCGDDGAPAGTLDAGSSSDGATSTCGAIPPETEGPYPGDGSNGPNILTVSGVVRSDIRSSIGSASGTAAGVPLTIELTVVNSNAACAPLAGRAVYLWHCDREGNYSMYTGAASAQNYLRGVQETDASGQVTFTSIFPACYSGRWPHVHFEIYPSLATAMAAGNKIRTSQLALPVEACNTVFATDGYSASVTNLRAVTLASDNVFRDGSTLQLAATTGSVAAGYTAALAVGVPV